MKIPVVRVSFQELMRNHGTARSGFTAHRLAPGMTVLARDPKEKIEFFGRVRRTHPDSTAEISLDWDVPAASEQLP